MFEFLNKMQGAKKSPRKVESSKDNCVLIFGDIKLNDKQTCSLLIVDTRQLILRLLLVGATKKATMNIRTMWCLYPL